MLNDLKSNSFKIVRDIMDSIINNSIEKNMNNSYIISLSEKPGKDIIKELIKNKESLTKEDLELLLKLMEKQTNKRRKGVIQQIKLQLNPKPKKENGKREDKDINFIVKSLNNKTETGLKLITSFQCEFGEIISKARKTGGRKKHNDFEIQFKNKENWYKIEHKGTQKYKKILDSDKPWSDSCQFYNGDPKPFSICEKYCKNWYDNFIKSEILTKKYNIKSIIPPYEVYKSQVYQQSAAHKGKRKNNFICELAEKSKQINKTVSLFQERKEFNNSFNITDKDLITMKNEIQIQYNKCQNAKDYWLKVNGDIFNNCNIKWFKNDVNDIKVINIIKFQTPRSSDWKFKCECDNNTSFIAHLRWGYNQCIGNLRLDFK